MIYLGIFKECSRMAEESKVEGRDSSPQLEHSLSMRLGRLPTSFTNPAESSCLTLKTSALFRKCRLCFLGDTHATLHRDYIPTVYRNDKLQFNSVLRRAMANHSPPSDVPWHTQLLCKYLWNEC